MSEIGQNLKSIVMKGIDLIGSKAGDLASNARQKVDTFNLENQKKDLLAEVGSKAYEMAQAGTVFPVELKTILQKVSEIDKELELIRDSGENGDKKNETALEDHDGKVYDDVPSYEKDFPSEPLAAVYTAKDNPDIPVIEVDEEQGKEEKEEACPLSSAINDLFEQRPQVDKMMDKVNSSLDELGNSLLKFSGEFDKKISDLASRMIDNDNRDSKE